MMKQLTDSDAIW